MSWFMDVLRGVHNYRFGVSSIAASTHKTSTPLRLGVLGAAAINPSAIFDPISTHPDVVISGIAARDRARAEKQIKQYKLQHARAYDSYQHLLDDPEIEAVYNPLPNGLHCEWTIKALRAGKHVLVEKPIASNTSQVREIRRVSEETGKLVLEAFHWRLHPAAHLVKSIVESGDYGAVEEVKARFVVPAGVIGLDDIRFKSELAGGSSMDIIYVYSAASYYALPSLRDAKVDVQSAVPRLNKRDKLIDEAMTADFTLTSPSSGRTVRCHTSCDHRRPWLWGIIPPVWDMTPYVTITLEKATIHFPNFPGPWLDHTITVTDRVTKKVTKHQAYVDGPEWGRRGERWWTTYRYQIEAFVEQVRAVQGGKTSEEVEAGGKLPWVGLEESERVMEIVDAAYERSGLGVRT